MPKVSVVIPAYNVSWCVRDALDSVARQTFRDYELIVVNDGSKDSTHDVVSQWLVSSAPPGGLLIDQENRRLGGARNTGIRHATGDYVAFLDADDTWRPRKLECVVAAFESGGMDLGLVCHDEAVTKNGKDIRVNRYGPYVQDMYRTLLFRGNRLSPSAVTVRRDLLEKVGGFSEDPGVHSLEDYDLWLRLACLTRFHFLHEVLGEFRLFPGSLGSDPEYNLSHALNVIERHAEEYFRNRRCTLLDRYRLRRRRGLAYRGACTMARNQGDPRKALGYIMTGVGLGPFDAKNWATLGLCAGLALADKCSSTRDS
jgi:teichuronic acid biosynthesis glycosyltransferase TuaG